MFEIIMIIIKICAAIIFSIFLGGVFYGFYASVCWAFDKEPVKLEWLMSDEGYEELKEFYTAIIKIIKNN